MLVMRVSSIYSRRKARKKKGEVKDPSISLFISPFSSAIAYDSPIVLSSPFEFFLIQFLFLLFTVLSLTSFLFIITFDHVCNIFFVCYRYFHVRVVD